ncbi:hypothetical protein EDB84DRAFT_1438234 [Lactarius hengduanensis]|nr:hypothetical protein EDB84DRAFT_1438234 [Lactarius hengduanensis]
MNYGNGDWATAGVSWKNSPCPSSSQEDYSDYEQPGVHSYHMSHASLPAEDSNFKPRGILTVDVDLQYPFHSEPSSIALRCQGSLPVGHPPPTPHHHVSARKTSCLMASGTPVGASIAPPSFCVTPPHLPVWSPFSYSPYDHRLAMSSVSPERLDTQYRGLALETTSSHHIPFRRFAKADSPTSHRLCTLRDHTCVPGFVLAAANHFAVRKTENDTCCHIFPIGSLARMAGALGEDTDLMPLENIGTANTGPLARLYDPGPLVDRIVRGSISIGDAENWAITRIRNIALSLDKDELFMDPWGRKGKSLKSSRKHSRFAERTKALHITSPTPAFSSALPAKL